MGALFVLISAIGFGSMALFANMAYADGVDTFSLLTLRFVIAASLLGALAVVRGARFPRGRALRSYAGMGVVYTAMAWGYFGALHHAPSATVALVLYVYPILVALAAFALRLDRFGWPEAGTTPAAHSLMVSLGAPASAPVGQARVHPGNGSNARTRAARVRAGKRQSIAASAFSILWA